MGTHDNKRVSQRLQDNNRTKHSCDEPLVNLYSFNWINTCLSKLNSTLLTNAEFVVAM